MRQVIIRPWLDGEPSPSASAVGRAAAIAAARQSERTAASKRRPVDRALPLEGKNVGATGGAFMARQAVRRTSESNFAAFGRLLIDVALNADLNS